MQGSPWFPRAVISVRARNILWLGVLGLTSPMACEAEPTDATGGETHFLRICDDDPDACGTALACLCGVCTVACQIEESCSTFPGARCTQQTSDSCGTTANVCEVTCNTDTECAPLSGDHRCVAGTCRLQVSEPPDDGGTAGSGPIPPPGCRTGTSSANEVVVLGDTFFATSHQITAYLEDLARGAGALETGERYRDLSRLSANALALSSAGIMDQYRDAASDAPVRVVVMNGGGADALLGSCEGDLQSCPVLTAAAAALDDVFAAMAADGVTGVVFAGYPDPQLDGVRQKIDVLRPLLEASCAGSPVPCHWVDLREPFYGHYDTYVLADGMNPTDEGSRVSATAIWAALEEHCLAQ